MDSKTTSKDTPGLTTKNWELVTSTEEGLHVMHGNLLVCEHINDIALGRLIVASPNMLEGFNRILHWLDGLEVAPAATVEAVRDKAREMIALATRTTH